MMGGNSHLRQSEKELLRAAVSSGGQTLGCGFHPNRAEEAGLSSTSGAQERQGHLEQTPRLLYLLALSDVKAGGFEVIKSQVSVLDRAGGVLETSVGFTCTRMPLYREEAQT